MPYETQVENNPLLLRALRPILQNVHTGTLAQIRETSADTVSSRLVRESVDCLLTATQSSLPPPRSCHRQPRHRCRSPASRRARRSRARRGRGSASSCWRSGERNSSLRHLAPKTHRTTHQCKFNTAAMRRQQSSLLRHAMSPAILQTHSNRSIWEVFPFGRDLSSRCDLYSLAPMIRIAHTTAPN